MDKREINNLKKKLQRLHGQLGSLGPLMRGTVVIIGTRNKQPYFSLNKDKKTHLIYLGKKREALAREYSDNYKKMVAIVEEMTTINMLLLKEDACP
jgi:hypothetical protein